MNERIYEIAGIDALMFRDGRPFSNEGSSLIARSLPAPLPGTVAGFLRTQLGERLGWDWNRDASVKAMEVPVLSPIFRRNGVTVIPKPADAMMLPVTREKAQGKAARAVPLRPIANPRGWCDTPMGIAPCGLSEDFEGKPEKGFRLWEWDKVTEWLMNPDSHVFRSMTDIEGLPREERTHTAIQPDSGIAMEGMLYTTEFVHFEEHQWKENAKHVEWSFLAKVGNGDADLDGAGFIGGERRIATVKRVSDESFPACPEDLKSKLYSSACIRMVLATPAIFRDGWKPGWLNENLEGTPPFAQSLKLRLITAIVERRTAVSGWDFVAHGPKPVRWLAPEGSVYFFEIVSGEGSELTNQGWLSPVSDMEQDRRDGYGLALWGVYNKNNEESANKGENR